MDTAFQVLLSYQFLLFCLAITAFTYIITKIVEYFFSIKGYYAKDSHIWSNLILPVMPIVLGSVGAILAKQYPYPTEIVSMSGRFAFGLVAGLLSGFVWRWVKALINSKISAIQPVNPVIAPDVGEGAAAEKAEDKENKV